MEWRDTWTSTRARCSGVLTALRSAWAYSFHSCHHNTVSSLLPMLIGASQSFENRTSAMVSTQSWLVRISLMNSPFHFMKHAMLSKGMGATLGLKLCSESKLINPPDMTESMVWKSDGTALGHWQGLSTAWKHLKSSEPRIDAIALMWLYTWAVICAAFVLACLDHLGNFWTSGMI